jgi:hypothetical protein
MNFEQKNKIQRRNDMAKLKPQDIVAGGLRCVQQNLTPYRISLIPIMLMILFISTSLLFAGARAPRLNPEDLVVKNLQVIDVPYDDGSGLQLIWEPLPFEARVISYRIYRGLTPDSLFYIGEIAVNPRIGVSSATMSFQDKDFNHFLDVASPAKLKRERGQPKDGPIFRAIPRDINVVGPMIRHFSLLGVVPKNEFYFRTTRVEKDGNVFAGLKPHQFTVFKKLIPGNTYYYTVLAVNERRVFLPHATPVSGTPIDNPPEPPSNLHVVYIEDEKLLKFEWDVPLIRDDIQYFAIYAVDNSNETNYLNWKENYDGNATDTPPAIRINRIELPQPFTPTTFAILNVVENKIIDNDGNVVYTFHGSVSDYKFALSYYDYGNLRSYGYPAGVRTKTNADIPQIPEIFIYDRPNDKGDYLALHWGRPLARITSANFLNPARTRLQLSYDFSTNIDNKIRNIYFEISDKDGNHIATINEFFQDNIFKVALPTHIADIMSSYDVPKEDKVLNVKMYFRTRGNPIDRNHYLTQQLIYDEAIMTLRPQELYYGEFLVDSYNFQVHKRTRFYNEFRMSRKFSFFDRETIDLIAYEQNVVRGVTDYCPEKKLLLVSMNLDLVFDEDKGIHIQSPIYLSEVDRVIPNLISRIAGYQENYDKAETDADREHWQIRIDHFTRQLENQEYVYANNETLRSVNSKTTDRARMRAFRHYRETERREFTYQIFLSDGQALLNVMEITLDEDGEPFFMIPISNWFSKDKTVTLIATLIFGLLVVIYIQFAKRGKDLYIRPIAGIEEIDNAIGRATEMGRPILFCPGLSSIGDVATLAGLSILSRVAKKAAEYDTRILVPCRDYIVLPIAQEIVREAHSEAGRPDSFDRNNIFFVSDQQFAYVAGVNGVMIREKTATNFYMGMFFAESLIMTETGNATGAIQIAGTDAVTQIPFFITTCDYTLIGEELYAASAYMARQPLMLGTLKAQDYAKFIILTFLIIGTVLGSLQVTAIIEAFPSK